MFITKFIMIFYLLINYKVSVLIVYFNKIIKNCGNLLNIKKQFFYNCNVCVCERGVFFSEEILKILVWKICVCV